MPIPTPTLCAACAESSVNPEVTEPHALTQRRGLGIRTLDHAYTEQYKCQECTARWLIYVDRRGASDGVTQR